MCIKAIANFDYEAAKDNLVETVKYLDAGKILGVAGKLLEINPKDVAQKIKDKVTDEDTRLPQLRANWARQKIQQRTNGLRSSHGLFHCSEPGNRQSPYP